MSARCGLRLALHLLALTCLACGSNQADGGDDAGGGCQRVDDDNGDWALRCGGPFTERSIGVGLDSDGSILVGMTVGRVMPTPEPISIGEFEIDPVNTNFVVAAFDAKGEAKWVREFVGDFHTLDHFSVCGQRSVLAGVDSGYESHEGPVRVVVLLDSDGEPLWTRAIPLSGDSPTLNITAVACDGAGNVALTGSLRGGADFGDGPLIPINLYDGFVAKFGPTGELEWSQLLANSEDNSAGAYSVAMTPAGDVVLFAVLRGTIDLGGQPVTAPDGALLLAKLDPAGGHVWATTFATDETGPPDALAIGADGSIAVGGDFASTIEIGDDVYTNPNPGDFAANNDGFVATFDAMGVLQWSTSISTMGHDDVNDLGFGPDGAIMVGGTIDGDRGLRIYEAGALAWEWVPGIGKESSASFTVGDGAFIMAGSTRHEFQFSEDVMVGRGADDFVLMSVHR
jgi:hypothetical protein